VLGAKAGTATELPMKKLALRLSSANQVTAVKVRCWDPNTSKEIIGNASSVTSMGKKLGSKIASSAHSGGTHKATYDVPVSSTEEANSVAKAMLEDLSLKYITGDAICKGNPDIKAGMLIKVKDADPRFNGKYYISGIVHKYSHQGSGEGGFVTIARVCRNAEGE
jgi:phage protein D